MEHVVDLVKELSKGRCVLSHEWQIFVGLY